MNLNNVDISKLPADVRKTFKRLQVMHAEKKIQNKAKSDFLSFVKCVWPEFVEGAHHRHIAKKFNAEIVNADSMQVYKEIKILSARPDDHTISHHLYGFISIKKTITGCAS